MLAFRLWWPFWSERYAKTLLFFRWLPLVLIYDLTTFYADLHIYTFNPSRYRRDRTEWHLLYAPVVIRIRFLYCTSSITVLLYSLIQPTVVEQGELILLFEPRKWSNYNRDTGSAGFWLRDITPGVLFRSRSMSTNKVELPYELKMAWGINRASTRGSEY